MTKEQIHYEGHTLSLLILSSKYVQIQALSALTSPSHGKEFVHHPFFLLGIRSCADREVWAIYVFMRTCWLRTGVAKIDNIATGRCCV